MIEDDLLGVSRTSDRQFSSAPVLRLNDGGKGLEPDGVESGSNESPSCLWPIHRSPSLAKFSSTASPIMRFALNSPSDQFQSSDYINKLLGEDPLLRSPTGDSSNLIVDNNGELVLPQGDSPIGTSRFTSYEDEAGVSTGPSEGAELSSREGGSIGSQSISALLDEKKGEQMLEFILPEDAGSSRKTERDQTSQLHLRPGHGFPASQVPPGADTARTSSSRGVTSKAPGQSIRHKAFVKSEKRTAGARIGKMKAAEVFSTAGASALPAAAAVDKLKQRKTTGLSTLPGGIGGVGKAGASHALTVDQAALNKLAILSGTKRFRGGAGVRKPTREVGQAGNAPHFTEEELKRIRRVKNRASVEKCRTKQRKRMESLEIELQMLQEENSTLLAVTKCVVSNFDVISRDVVAITGSKPVLHG